MKKIVVAGRNDSGKSTLIGEIYKGLRIKEYFPLIVGSGTQDEKPYIQKGIHPAYLTIAAPEPGRDLAADLDKIITAHINQMREKNRLIQHARKTLEELNKVRQVLDLGNIQQKDLPPAVNLPNVVVAEAVGINDGYKSVECQTEADILITVIPAGIKNEILMEAGSILLDEATILVVTKMDNTPREIANTNLKMLRRIYPQKPIIPLIATSGVRTELLLEELGQKLNPA